jgi:hypothetical protein
MMRSNGIIEQAFSTINIVKIDFAKRWKITFLQIIELST